MIYLDNAATTFPKPRRVIREVERCISQYCGNPGRGSHALSLAAATAIYSCREALSDYFGLHAPERVVFTQNTTHALNFAIKGSLRPGDHVLISELEHNAVRRPICRLQQEGVIGYDIFPVVGKSNAEVLSGIQARIRSNTRAIVCTHASNICSISLPLKEIGAFCHKQKLLFIVDAAQSAGLLPIDMTAMHIDALAVPGHKSLYGIQGCGALLLSDRLLPCPLLEGGSGVDSEAASMPADPPERYEAGTLPTPAIVGLLEGVRSLQNGVDREIASHEQQLFCDLRDHLCSLPHITVYAPEHVGSVLLFNKKDIPAAEVGHQLFAKGICVRTGYHCAPLAHNALGTPPGGALRIGLGRYNTTKELDVVWQALK